MHPKIASQYNVLNNNMVIPNRLYSSIHGASAKTLGYFINNFEDQFLIINLNNKYGHRSIIKVNIKDVCFFKKKNTYKRNDKVIIITRDLNVPINNNILQLPHYSNNYRYTLHIMCLLIQNITL